MNPPTRENVDPPVEECEWINIDEGVWTHLKESEDRLTLKRECGEDPPLKRVYGPTLKTALRSQSCKELKLLAEAGAGIKFRLQIPAPGQTQEIYTYRKSNKIYLLITI